MEHSSTGIRQRRTGITKIVEDLDIFEKVVDNVKEEQKASSGLLSFICFSIITILVFGEVWQYFLGRHDFVYRFDVDTEMDVMPNLEIDMVVATACNNLAVVSSMDSTGGMFQPIQESLKKDPTRFEFTDEEQLYWTVLRHAHATMNEEGIRGLEELQYIDDDVENTLEHLADEKQKEEQKHIQEERAKNKGKQKGFGNMVIMMSNGMGMFQIVSANGVDEGTACRVHGKFAVRKGKEEKVMISIGNSLGLAGIFAHEEGGQKGNISHRIEKFNFGPRISGLVTPLAGGEQISESGQDIYRYFIKVVPTKIFSGFFGGYTLSYQYAVTFLKKQLQDGEHSHGGILFEYEFCATVIEIREVVKSVFGLLLRICAVIGGVYATSNIVNTVLQCVLNVGSHKVEPVVTQQNGHTSDHQVLLDSFTMGGGDTQQFSYLPKILNGGFAGIVGVTCVFPIDLVKTRLQNQRVGPDGKAMYSGILDCAKKTWASGGASPFSKVRALYSGSAVNIILITPEKAIKLVANDFFRHKLSKPGETSLSAPRGMIAGGLAGMFQVIVTTPMELLKIQMQDQGRTLAPGQKKVTALELTTKLLKEKGIAGLYKGLSSTMARDVTFSVIYFPLFAYLNSLGPRKSDGSGDAVFYCSFFAGLSAGALSSFSVTPLDVIKTRMQTIKKAENEIKYKGIADAFVKILKMEGPTALFKGAACRMMVMAPLFGIAQTVYYIGVAEKVLGLEKIKNI